MRDAVHLAVAGDDIAQPRRQRRIGIAVERMAPPARPAAPSNSAGRPTPRPGRNSPRNPSAISRSAPAAPSPPPATTARALAPPAARRNSPAARRAPAARLAAAADWCPGSAPAARSPVHTSPGGWRGDTAVERELVRRQAGGAAGGGATAVRTRPMSRPAPARVAWLGVATPADSATSRRSISTNRPDSGRLDQSALAVTWNSTNAAGAMRRLGDQRRAIGQRRPGMGARSALGSASTWRVIFTSAARQAGEGRAGGNGASAGRLGSRTSRRRTAGRRPAAAPASAGRYRRSAARPCAGRQSGSAAHLARPMVTASRSAPGRQRPVGQDQHRKSRASAAWRDRPHAARYRAPAPGSGKYSGPANGVSAVVTSPASSPTGRRRQRSSSSTTDAAVGGPSSTSRFSRLRSSGGNRIGACAGRRARRQVDDGACQRAAVAALGQHGRAWSRLGAAPERHARSADPPRCVGGSSRRGGVVVAADFGYRPGVAPAPRRKRPKSAPSVSPSAQ